MSNLKLSAFALTIAAFSMFSCAEEEVKPVTSALNNTKIADGTLPIPRVSEFEGTLPLPLVGEFDGTLPIPRDSEFDGTLPIPRTSEPFIIADGTLPMPIEGNDQ